MISKLVRRLLPSSSETDDSSDFSTGGVSPALRQGSIRRAGTVIRSPLEGAKKDKESTGKLPGNEVSLSSRRAKIFQLLTRLNRHSKLH